jgi:hypothetical protein
MQSALESEDIYRFLPLRSRKRKQSPFPPKQKTPAGSAGVLWVILPGSGRLPVLSGRERGAAGTENGEGNSERQQHVHHLLAVAGLLHIGDLAASAVGYAGLGDLAGCDGIVVLDVFWPHDASDDQFTHLEVDADFLLAFDHQIAIGQDLRDDGGDIGGEGLLPLHAA